MDTRHPGSGSNPVQDGWDQLSSAMSDAVVHADVNRIITRVNPAFTRMFGFSSEEILGKSTLEIYTAAESFHEQGRLRYNPDAQGPSIPYETEYRRKNGECFRATSIGAQIRTETGDVSGFMLLVKDEAENKRMASDYVRLAAAVDQATENVVITDPGGHIQYVNPSFERTTGYSRDEAVGATPAILKSGEHDQGFYREIWTTILSGRPWSGRIKNRRKDGSFYTEDCIISPVFSAGGEIMNFVAVKHDITRTLALEEQTRRSRRIESLGRLAGGVAHDINNMLFPILGYTEIMLLDMPKTSLMREPVEEIRKAGIKVRNLVRQLLAFSRKQTLEVGPLDLNRVIGGFEKLMRKTVREDVEMVFELDASLPLVTGDLGQLEQIIMNLLVNAQHAMPDGGKIIIKTGTGVPDLATCPDVGTGKPVPYAYMRITDTGHGMDERTRRRIFEPFFTTRDENRGTGLGLATVYGIVKQHNGHIDVKTSPGNGAGFTVYLPVAAPVKDGDLVQQAPANGSAPVPVHTPGKKAKKAMLAEDNAMAAGFAAKALETLGYDVIMAGDSRDCISFLDDYRGSLDLLLSDVIMPKVNGRELQGIVSEKVHGVKTLFMSGYSHDVIARHGHLEKGLDFIAKPFSIKALSQKLGSMG